MAQEFVRFQADHHPLVQTDGFDSVEEYCLHLIHLKAYAEAAKLGRGKVALDLGCNNGYGTAIIASSARRIVGVDVSESAVSEARRQRVSENLSFVCVAGDKLPFDDKEFDLVCSFQVIEHVSDYQPYLSEIVRVLKDDGVVMFTTPNARIRLDPGMKPWFPFHIHEFSGGELRDLLRQWFLQVEVMGLFATKELYQTERARVERSREMARRRSKSLFPPYIELRTGAIDLAKSMLPVGIIRGLQRLAHKLVHEPDAKSETGSIHRPGADSAYLNRFSERDLFYEKQNIDEALDLMAICRKMEMP